MATSAGSWRASKRLAIRGLLTMGVPLVVRKPLSFQSAEWVWAIKKAYLESVWILALGYLECLVKAINSAFCEEVPIGFNCVSGSDHCICCLVSLAVGFSHFNHCDFSQLKILLQVML